MSEAAYKALSAYLGPRFSSQTRTLSPSNERELLGALELLSTHGLRLHEDIRLSRRAFGRIDPVDTLSGVVASAAGATLAEIEAHAQKQDLTLGPLPPSCASLQLGDFLEGPLGGLRAAVGGRLEPLALALEVLLPDGTRYRSHPSPRSAAGPDLKGLFLGTGGRFGVLLGAQVRLHARPSDRRWLRIEAPDARSLTIGLRRAVGAGAWLSHALLAFNSGFVEVIGSARGVERDLKTTAVELAQVGGSVRDEERPAHPALAHDVELGWRDVVARLEARRPLTLHRITIESVVAESSEALAPAKWTGDWSALGDAVDARKLLGGIV